MAMKEAYLREVENQLNTWSTEVDGLTANVGHAGMNSRSQLRQMVQRFSVEQDKARRQLKTFREADDLEFEQRKDGLIQLMVTLREEFDQFKRAAQSAGHESIGWAEGLAETDDVSSIGWAEGLAKEDMVESIGWAEGVAEEDLVTSKGWAEGYKEES